MVGPIPTALGQRYAIGINDDPRAATGAAPSTGARRVQTCHGICTQCTVKRSNGEKTLAYVKECNAEFGDGVPLYAQHGES